MHRFQGWWERGKRKLSGRDGGGRRVRGVRTETEADGAALEGTVGHMKEFGPCHKNFRDFTDGPVGCVCGGVCL